MKIINIFFILIYVSFMSCHVSKNTFNPDDTPQIYIYFGSGGGFTGQVSAYYLTNDGALYEKNVDTLNFIGKVEKRTTTQIFSNFKKLELDQFQINQPGNRFYFIDYCSNNSNHSLKWGKEALENQSLETYYSILMNVVKVSLKK